MPSPTAAPSSPSSPEEKHDCQIFHCNICQTSAKDPVVSFCGHLFCWSCLHQQLETGTSPAKSKTKNEPNNVSASTMNESKSFQCPACKAQIDQAHIVPLYGREGEKGNDSRKNIAPPRPRGRNQTKGAFGFGSSDYETTARTTDIIIIVWFSFLFVLWYLFC